MKLYLPHSLRKALLAGILSSCSAISTLFAGSFVACGVVLSTSFQVASGDTVPEWQELQGVSIGPGEVSDVSLKNCTITGQLITTGALRVAGNMVVDKSGFTLNVDLWDSTTYSNGHSGFAKADYTVQLVTEPSKVTLQTGVTWEDTEGVAATYAPGTGMLTVAATTYGSVYYVNENGDTIYRDSNESFSSATGIVMNHGKLSLLSPLSERIRNNRGIMVQSGPSNLLYLGENSVLYERELTISDSAGLRLSGDGEYVLESEDLQLDPRIRLGHDWGGTVSIRQQNLGEGADLVLDDRLFNQDLPGIGHMSTVKIAGVTARNLKASTGRHSRLLVDGDMLLSGSDSKVVGKLNVTGTATLAGPGAVMRIEGNMEANKLVLGSEQDKAELTVTGTLKAPSITLAHVESVIKAGVLGAPVDLVMTPKLLNDLGAKVSQGAITLIELTDAPFPGSEVMVNGADASGGIGETGSKYFVTIKWNDKLLQATGIRNRNYVAEKLGTTDSNAGAGAALLSGAFADSDPQISAPMGALAALLNSVDSGTMTAEQLTAAAGASTAVLGQALSGDVERQLRAIRNRAAMGNHGTNSVAWDDKGGLNSMSHPSRYFAWVNAEGNRAEQNADGTAPGYTLNSWGGTVGAGMQVNSNLTMGLALSAMYGDLRSDGPDSLDGDMDTTYMSAFARYESGKWCHAFIGTAGTMVADYKRSVSHAADSYHTYGDTDGYAFGLMYELSRDFTLGSKGTLSPVFNISYRHAEVDGLRESGADAALNVGEQSLDTITVGLGARYAAVVGEQAFNRACHIETRALLKYDFGDTQNNIDVGFVNQDTRASIESAEMGAFGVELGAGISVPAGTGSFFADGAVELRSDYTNFNATMGYRIQF